MNVPPQCESLAALEPLAITITTLPEPSSEPVPDPNITLTSKSKEEVYKLAEDNRMEVALMSRPTEFKAGLPKDFSGKNDDATRWLLAIVRDASPTQTYSFLPASWVGDTHEETDVLPISDREEKGGRLLNRRTDSLETMQVLMAKYLADGGLPLEAKKDEEVGLLVLNKN